MHFTQFTLSSLQQHPFVAARRVEAVGGPLLWKLIPENPEAVTLAMTAQIGPDTTLNAHQDDGLIEPLGKGFRLWRCSRAAAHLPVIELAQTVEQPAALTRSRRAYRLDDSLNQQPWFHWLKHVVVSKTTEDRLSEGIKGAKLALQHDMTAIEFGALLAWALAAKAKMPVWLTGMAGQWWELRVLPTDLAIVADDFLPQYTERRIHHPDRDFIIGPWIAQFWKGPSELSDVDSLKVLVDTFTQLRVPTRIRMDVHGKSFVAIARNDVFTTGNVAHHTLWELVQEDSLPRPCLPPGVSLPGRLSAECLAWSPGSHTVACRLDGYDGDVPVVLTTADAGDNEATGAHWVPSASNRVRVAFDWADLRFPEFEYAIRQDSAPDTPYLFSAPGGAKIVNKVGRRKLSLSDRHLLID